MIKWGIIGAGNIAHRFCRALVKDKRAKLEAVSCRTIEKAKAFKMIYPCNKADEVKYFFGANGEKMSCSDHPSKMFETAKELGSTTGFFCGHDHYNNLSVAYQGIRLTYGMRIDYLAMPGIENDDAQRGAELITLHSDSSWDLEQIPLSNINCK